jgi:MFS family permease
VAPLLGIINEDIGPDPNYVWIALCYILTLAIGQVLVGRVSDLFGRRWFFVGGSAMALLGCIISAVATSVPMLIGGTVLVGLSSASQLSYVFVLGELIPYKHRFLIMSFLFSWAVPFSGFGPAYAYIFVQHTKHTWRSCYYLMIVVDGLALICWALLYAQKLPSAIQVLKENSYYPPTFDEKYKHKKTKRQVIQDFDFIGLILLVGGLLIFLMGISWGGQLYPWKSAHVIITIVVGFMTLVVFTIYEAFVPLNEPLVPMYLFKNLRWVATMIMVAMGATVYFCFSIVWPTMVFSIYTSDLTYGGLLCTITGLGTNVGEIICGLICRRLGNQRIQVVVVATMMGVFLGGKSGYPWRCLVNLINFPACAVATPDNRQVIMPLLFLGCACMGYVEMVGTTVIGIAIRTQSEIGTAVGVAGSMRSTVSTIGSAIYTSILANRLGKTIPTEVPPKLIAAGLPASSVSAFLSAITVGTPAAFAKVQGLTPAIEAIGIRAYKVASIDAYRTVFFSTIAFSAVCVLCACFTPNVDDRMTDKVVATLHHQQADVHRDEEVAEK